MMCTELSVECNFTIRGCRNEAVTSKCITVAWQQCTGSQLQISEGAQGTGDFSQCQALPHLHCSFYFCQNQRVTSGEYWCVSASVIPCFMTKFLITMFTHSTLCISYWNLALPASHCASACWLSLKLQRPSQFSKIILHQHSRSTPRAVQFEAFLPTKLTWVALIIWA